MERLAMEHRNEPFEFDGDGLDTLWDRVHDLKPNESLETRHSTQGAQGMLNLIKDDKRFLDFDCRIGGYRTTFQIDDARLFTVRRKPLRKPEFNVNSKR